MSTALLEPETQTVTFVAIHCKEQVLTRVPERLVRDGMGGNRVVKESDFLVEQEAINRQRASRGEDPLEYDSSPWKVQFRSGLYSTSDPIIIEWLRGHQFFKHNGPSGFNELEPAPEQREPTTAQQMREVEQALLHRDLLRAEAALEVEQETHRRPDVLKAAVAAVDGLKEVLDADASGAGPDEGSTPSLSSS